MRKFAYIMCGISGSGKSAVASALQTKLQNANSACAVVSADLLFYNSDGEYNFDLKKLPEAHNKCLKNYIYHITAGIPNVVVDNTNLSVDEMSPYVRAARAFGYEVTIVRMHTTPEFSRCDKGIPLDKIQNQYAKYLRFADEQQAYWSDVLRTTYVSFKKTPVFIAGDILLQQVKF